MIRRVHLSQKNSPKFKSLQPRNGHCSTLIWPEVNLLSGSWGWKPLLNMHDWRVLRQFYRWLLCSPDTYYFSLAFSNFSRTSLWYLKKYLPPNTGYVPVTFPDNPTLTVPTEAALPCSLYQTSPPHSVPTHSQIRLYNIIFLPPTVSSLSHSPCPASFHLPLSPLSPPLSALYHCPCITNLHFSAFSPQPALELLPSLPLQNFCLLPRYSPTHPSYPAVQESCGLMGLEATINSNQF